MGAFWSHAKGPSLEEGMADAAVESSKRQRLSECFPHERPQFIPGLPDELSLQILARVPRGFHCTLKLVSRGWHDVLLDNEVYDIRKELGITEEWLYILLKDEDDKLSWHALDPVLGRWQRLRPMPEMIPEDSSLEGGLGWGWFASIGASSISLMAFIRSLFRRKDLVDRSPFCGCAAAALDGCLYVVGGFSRASAMDTVWRYDPRTNEWSEAASMSTPRAYCKTAVLHDKLYVIGGVNRVRGGLTPLQSAEVYESSVNTWKPIPSMPFARAQIIPTAFLADMLKPIATGMASFKGKLFVPQSLYSWPFFMDVGGEVLDPSTNTWMEMPQGMGEGWPARQAGTKLSVVLNGNLFALDPTGSTDGSKIKVYDSEADVWKVVLRKVPVLPDLTDSESPYLLAAFMNRLHVITKDISANIIVFWGDVNEGSSKSCDFSGNSPDSEYERWTSIAMKNFGMVDLVTCQVLDL